MLSEVWNVFSLSRGWGQMRRMSSICSVLVVDCYVFRKRSSVTERNKLAIVEKETHNGCE